MTKREIYMLRGYDIYGHAIEETITHSPAPWWKRILRRIGYFFGIGRWKVVNKITLRDR